ncbi:hypothetical protein SAY87_000005 [Trapa incisa]|uniref:Uncharacterized protein n=1 Tax=Trapa incisa TaxID=236973 RepID=A0AAN7GQZ9_9MYRT|nr:hypothetical protein SAY87_000005 [Trapa incisa]
MIDRSASIFQTEKQRKVMENKETVQIARKIKDPLLEGKQLTGKALKRDSTVQFRG